MSLPRPAPPFPDPSLKFAIETEAVAAHTGDQLLGVVQGLYDPSGLVLDVGCGQGRLAYALRRGGHAGTYLGVDVRPGVIDWLTANFTSFDPDYAFAHLDVRNGRYNPGGKLEASTFKIPRLARPPTLVLALSLFTHMLEADVRGYLERISLLMDKQTLLYATFFLLNADQRRFSRFTQAPVALDHTLGSHARVRDPEHPEAAIGFEEERLRDWIADAGLFVNRTLYGKWCGRSGSEVFQDTLLMRRVPRAWRKAEVAAGT